MKAHATIRIESDVWEQFQTLFPRQASPMIEEYLREVVSTGSNDGLTRVEIQARLNEAKKNRADVEREERVLQQQLNSYDAEVERRRDLMESETAKSNKEKYFELPSEIRDLFGSICGEMKSNKIFEFGEPIIPFNLYYSYEDIQKKLFDIAEENNYFELKAMLFNFNRKKAEVENESTI